MTPPERVSASERWARWLAPVTSGVVCGCLLWFLFQSRRWPLVGDAVSVHYLVLLMGHGMAPYRDIVDAQMPGTYLLDWLVLHTFGGTAIGLRLFDFSLILAAIVAMIAIAWPLHRAPFAHSSTGPAPRDDRFAAFIAGGLFALVHGRDGVQQAGQRDLIMAVLLLAAYAFAFHALRRRRPVLLALSGFCALSAVTIKPTVLPAAAVVLLLAVVQLFRRRQPLATSIVAIAAGALAPIVAVVLFLAKEHAVAAFLDAARGMWPYYATLDRQPLGYLLLHSFSPLLPLLLIGCVIALLRLASANFHAFRGSWETCALYCGMVLSLFSFVAQGKGFIYHRYPFLAFLLLVLLLACSRAMNAHRRSLIAGMAGAGMAGIAVCLRMAGAAGLIYSGLVLAPVCAYKISRLDWRNDDYYRQLSADLQALGGSRLSGHIQCLDAFSGCVTTLDRMGLVQSTGFLVDFYFFAPLSNPTLDAMREHFWQQIQRQPPAVFVITKQNFPSTAAHPDSWDRVRNWPAFDAFLNSRYTLIEERTPVRDLYWTSHAEHPAPYRIYALKQ